MVDPENAAAPHLVLVTHNGAIGGVMMLYALVAKEACRQGWRCTVIAPDGPGHAKVDWGDARVFRPDRLDERAVEILERVTADAWLVVASVGPETTPLLPWLCAMPRCILTSLGSQEVMEKWLGPTRLDAFTAALAAHHHVQVAIPGWNFLDDTCTVYAIEPQRCHWFPHCIEPVVGTPLPRSKRRGGEVLAPGRLSPERRPFIMAAADLASEANRTLVVAGVGEDSSWIHDYLVDRGDVRFRITGDPTIEPLLRTADVAVAVGVTALEAAARGCIVVVPRQLAGGGIAGVIHDAASFTNAHQHNFHGFAEAISAATAWNLIDQVSDASVQAIASQAREAASPATSLQALVDATRDATGGDHDLGHAKAQARLAMEVEHEFDDLREWVAQVTDARDYYRARYELAVGGSLPEPGDPS